MFNQANVVSVVHKADSNSGGNGHGHGNGNVCCLERLDISGNDIGRRGKMTLATALLPDLLIDLEELGCVSASASVSASARANASVSVSASAKAIVADEVDGRYMSGWAIY